MARQSRSRPILVKDQSPSSWKGDDCRYTSQCNHGRVLDESLSLGHIDLLDVPHRHGENCHDFVCNHDLYEKLSREYAAYEDVHGAINVQVMLWGPSGHGKREIATHFAKSHASLRTRTVLWVEAGNAITFVRDLRFAYQLMTGNIHPSDVSTRWQLHKISQALSQCTSEWFMVCFDISPALQYPALNDTGLDLTSYLPKGQILYTYSPSLRASETTSSASRLIQVPLGLLQKGSTHYEHVFRHDLAFIHVFMDRKSLAPYAESACADASLKRFSQHLLSTSLGASVARISRLSIDQYQHKFRYQKLGLSSRRPHPDSEAAILTKLSLTMEMVLDTFRDIDPIVEGLLVALAPVSPRDIPVRLVLNLKAFRAIPSVLEDSIELLNSASLITLKTITTGERFISVHDMIHQWLNAKYRPKRSDTGLGYRRAVHDWARLLDQELPELVDQSHRQKYWLLFELVLAVAKSAERIDSREPILVRLLHKVAMFMKEYLVAPVEAKRLLGRALYLTTSLCSEDAGFDLDMERIKLHSDRSRLCTLLGDYSQAQLEIDSAQICLSRLSSTDTDERNALEHKLDEDRIELLLRQGNYDQARRLVTNLLATRLDLPVENKVMLHYWAVCCVADDRTSIVTALQHSHLAMTYWLSLSEDERWGGKSFATLAWVNGHTELLLLMQRGRGALVFMPTLLDHYIAQCLPETEAIWRIAYYMVRENIGIQEFKLAEAVACRVLSLHDFTLLDGTSLAWALSMLHVLGAIFTQLGRYVESEGIFRACLVAIESRRPPLTSGQGDFSASNMWLELCHTLLIQGKVEQAEAAHRIAIDKGYEKFEGADWKKLALAPSKELPKVYERVLQAARDRRNGIYNAEDRFLDAAWPRNFPIAIEVLGDPFEHIDNGVDGVSHVQIPTGKMLGKWSMILELLGFHFDSSTSDTKSIPEHDQSNWYKVFDVDLVVVGDSRQQRMSDYWHWCDCRRKRRRSSSIGYDMTFRNKIARDEEARKGAAKDNAQPKWRQKCITEMFLRIPKYSRDCCPPDCPCIGANGASDGLVSRLESEKLHIWQPPNNAVHEEKHAAYLRALRDYRYRFGPRPAVPYGMSFVVGWTAPSGPTEPNGEANSQHRFFWAPDFVVTGDAEHNCGYLGQDENSILSHPAMTVRSDGSFGGLPDLPNITITSYKLGEEVRENRDLFDREKRQKWIQTNIIDYLDEEEEQLDNANSKRKDRDKPFNHETCPSLSSSSSAPLSPFIVRPRRRRGRNPLRVPLPRSRSSSRFSLLGRSRSRSRSISPINLDASPDSREARTQSRATANLKLFSIDSVNAIGPAFDTEDFHRQSLIALDMQPPYLPIDHTSQDQRHALVDEEQEDTSNVVTSQLPVSPNVIAQCQSDTDTIYIYSETQPEC